MLRKTTSRTRAGNVARLYAQAVRTGPIATASTLVAASTLVLLIGTGCATIGHADPVQGRPRASSRPASTALPSSTSGTARPVAPSTDPTVETDSMADLIVEIHVPLTPTPGLGANDYAFPWIDDVEAYLGELDGSDGEMYDDGEELGDEYLFFVSGAPEADLIQVARRVARVYVVPTGIYAVINDSEGDMGEGRRVDLQ